MNQSERLRLLFKELETEVAAIAHAAASGTLDLDTAISLGQCLVNLEKTAHKALDPVKNPLRLAGWERSAGIPGAYHFKADDGTTCVVVIPRRPVQIRKGTDMEKVKKRLGGHFSRFFNERTSYFPVKTFHEAITQDPLKATIALDAVTLKEGTPRVSFND